MNAYELADKLEWHWDNDCRSPAVSKSANMLRQQADRIAELEKESANLQHSLKNALIFIDNHKQTKPLSDEEIKTIWMKRPANCAENVLRFARAIEERHGIK